MEQLSTEEVAILLATRESEGCQSLLELSQRVETSVQSAAETIDRLVARGVLEEVDSFDGIRYGYAGNDAAQQIYREIHQLTE